MTLGRSGGDLFVVDNSDPGWTGLRYLQEWCDLASSFDIATGFFEVGSLLALDGKWRQLDKIRILMGADVTFGTRKVILEALRVEATTGSSAPERLLDLTTVAERLSVKRSTLYARVLPELRPIRIGRRVLFSESAVEECVRRAASSAEAR